MEAYGAILNLVVPVFFLLFFIEKGFEWYLGKKVIRGLDSVSSFSSGITNVVKDVLGLSISILTYGWLVDKIAIVHVQATWLVYAIGFVAVDFQGYWVHRWAHEINFLWNRHIIHHSSEEFNLSCALRQSISTIVNYFTILLLPAALFGVPPEVVAVIGPIHLFLQYWYHTQLIGKMGWLEYVIVTPSQHRVHHAINPEYMDKNYGQVFNWWDKLFGTFQEELDDVKPVYGVSRPVRTWNPIKINFLHAWLLLKDAWRAQNGWDKFRIWFMPTGWRPADVAEKYPVFKINDVYHFEKYDTRASRTFVAWAWVQLFFNYFLLVYFFAYLGKIGSPGVFYYGGFIFLSVFAYTELMDRSRYAVFFELAKSALGLYAIFRMGGDWFGARNLVGVWYVWVVGIYFVVAAAAVAYFTEKEVKRDAPENMGSISAA
ncbi:MAG: sterol desaturase family protein [Saprospiraceae bacterium]|nr:sterol desaturase family protein [Saprospiraceae bacterium]